YWDSAFLRSTLGVIQRRKSDLLRGGLAVSAYAWTHGRSLDWGAGGPERWPSARPYLTPAGSQDQRGFRIYDWYRTISQAVLGYELPIFLLEAGSPAHECVEANTADLIARLLYREDVPNPQDEEAMLEAIPDCVFGAAMRLPGQPGEAAFDAVANRLNRATQSAAAKGLPVSPKGSHPIRQYVLLPSFEWGVSEWHLDAVKPFVRKHRPVVGFSVDEALLASSVLVIGNENEIPEQDLDVLRQAGCKVERIDERGTSLASLLAER
ncbi:MAG: hypothetical protein HY835_02410, partial [Anaerolineae bacterium]|nr:hypothetical protein [Anaerolineae bacterium]